MSFRQVKEEKTLIQDIEVNYKIAGSAEPLLVLHGWGGSSGSWTKVQEILAERGYKVIVPDLPGFGKSFTPFQSWSVNDYCNFVSDFIKELKIDNFFLLGHSFGGRVAIKFTIAFPEKVKRLILCSSTGIKPKPGLKTKIIYRLAKIGNALFTPKISARFRDSARNLFYIFLRHKDYVKANGIMRETIKKVLGEDLLPELSKVKTKTLIIWGEKDKLVPVKYAQIFKENIRDSRLEILPKIGHSPHLEAPKELSKLIGDFFR